MARDKSLITASLLVVFGLAGVSGGPPRDRQNLDKLFLELQEKGTTGRAAEELLKVGQRDDKAREWLASRLPGCIRKGNQLDFSVWSNCVNIAGKLKLEDAPAASQHMSPEPQDLQGILRGFEAPEWKTRAKAFYRFVALGGGDTSNVAGPVKEILRKYPNQADQVKLGLIRLLERENSIVHERERKGQKLGELSDYYGDVIAAVVSFNDIRSMNALLGAITSGYSMAIGALAAFAPASLDPVLAKLQDPDPVVRFSALNVLERMLEPPNYDKVKNPVYRSKIKQAFIRATSDENPVVRKVGVRGLGALGDPDAIPLLEKLARDDPAFLPHQANGGKDLYFVRLEAQRALAQITSKNRRPD